ncbi:MAG: ethanolamine ammonia-lyase reactivating factor EutA [Lachnospiraceae bacterium]|nr:ethanolamine ammonia-lyase reactivating factor EutA [Lachnospiraceae bacterium]
MNFKGNEVLSVGIDIGTTTMSMIVSRLEMKNTAASYMVPEVNITSKNIIYRSGIYMTPLISRTMLDGEKISQVIADEYHKAGIKPSDVDTGAVIVTGESALKENARVLIEQLSRFAGDFVVSTAGPDLESIIAGRGSGAEEFSKKYGCTVANLDIGGGTTNISVFSCGELLGQTCLDAGGRLVIYDPASRRISYVSKRLNDAAALYGASFSEGSIADELTLHRAAGFLADAIIDSLRFSHREITRVTTTSGSSPLVLSDPVQYVSFSGGVADCYYNDINDVYTYGDLGPALAQELKKRVPGEGFTVIRPTETIRATVVGAGTYMTNVSGSTISYNEDIFPIKNLSVLVVSPDSEELLYRGEPGKLIEELRWYLGQSQQDNAAICIKGKEKISYGELRNLAESLLETDRSAIDRALPLIIICENDMAKALGMVIRRSAGIQKSILCLDRIKARSGDYIDIGYPVMDGIAVPVVIKTLIFG